MKRAGSIVLLVAACLTGCKSTNLATQQAQAGLQSMMFVKARAVQTVDFVSGGASRPQAIDQFLYAKRWLDCPQTTPGAFSNSAHCRLNAEGHQYGIANGWTFEAVPGQGCDRCTTVRVAVATAQLKTVDRVAALDKSHAEVTYTYDVVPTELGGQLSAWMAAHNLSWCGEDPAARGGWNSPRSTQAAFVRTGGSWALGPAPDSFATAFGPPGPPPAEPRPCPGSGS